VTADLLDPRLYINRELSWLAFNERVLQQAREPLPLFEKLKFLGIFSSNLDEFFMVRVAGLKQQILAGVPETAADRMTPPEQLSMIRERAQLLVAEQYRLWRDDIAPALAAAGIAILEADQLSPEQKTAARHVFTQSVFPALTPLAVDSGHPFPHLRSKSLNLAVLLRRGTSKRRKGIPPADASSLAVVQVPGVLSRLIPIPSPGVTRAFVLLEELIASNLGDLFPGFQVLQTAAFRVTRNSDLNIDDEDTEDLLTTVQEELRRRERGAAVRLEVGGSTSEDIQRELREALNLEPADTYRALGPLQVYDLIGLADGDTRQDLRVETFVPVTPASLRDVDSVFPVIAARDILLHHPYESFDPVVRLVEEAAEDPHVLAIKQTLYRTSGDSPIARALGRAAENGKQVAVLVELKARLDEANNIAWARRLEETGVHVVYGIIGLKTHAKVLLVVRREGSGIRRYVHLGTGNYNPNTARHYTDLSLLTARPELADDVTALFNMLTGYADPPQWKRIAVAPLGLMEKVLALIDRETQRAKAGGPARILGKMNSLVEEEVIRALYRASQAGVQIDLVVRGICCLRPGVPGVSDNIRVTSIVDRFLEHSRVFAFGAEKPELWVSSADWMPRNFHRRVEVMFLVDDPAIRTRLLDEVLGLALRDNIRARSLGADGAYTPVPAGEPVIRSQMAALEATKRASEPKVEPLIRSVPVSPIPDDSSGPVRSVVSRPSG
jgi:polyphosphate kinase